ncbi:MAG TPA: M56 family metallopeptidase [Lacipirellulaceae bacterium]|nr:M56 family metallopeptidase [Lacipirellulaceae bacterium]
MSTLSLLETLVSLSVQVGILIWLTSWATRNRRLGSDPDVYWSAMHVCILVLTAAAFYLPHVRLITWADFQPTESHPFADEAVAATGRLGGWIWVAGSSFILAACVGGIVRATMLVRRAAIDPSIGQIGDDEIDGITTPTRIETRVSTDNISPFCWQFHRPVIVVPEIVRTFPSSEQAAILRHELAHLRLQHPLHLFLQRMVEAIYWFHPMVWWSSKQAAAAREIRCDRAAVRSRHEVVDYLRSLLRLIESKVRPLSRLPAGVGFMGDASLLSQRANILGEYVEHAPAPVKAGRAVAIITLFALTCSLVWLPVNPYASRRSAWSPWPSWSSQLLNATGIEVRDYEVDGHRLSLHNHDQ